MQFLLDTIYSAALLLSTPYLLYKMITTERYRAGLRQRLGLLNGLIPSSGRSEKGSPPLGAQPPSGTREKSPGGGEENKPPRVWVHCASVGEVLAARSLVSGLENAIPGLDILISTNTNTGYAVAQQNYAGKPVFYFPLDFSWIMRRAFKTIQPDSVMLVELEIWPNFLLTAAERRVPVILVNGRITEKYKLYKRMFAFSKGFFENLGDNVYCVQNETYAHRLMAIGVPESQIRVTGTVKFDNIVTHVDDYAKNELTATLGISETDLVIVAGSTHSPEEEILSDVYAELKSEFRNLRLILVPRHIERADEVVRTVAAKGFDCVRKTELERLTGEQKKRLLTESDKIIIVDTVGELVSVYSIANCVFVGKSLSSAHGGHNMLEPAGLGKPVLFGPHNSNFEKEAQMLLARSAAVEVRDGNELCESIRALLRDRRKAEKMGGTAREVVLSHKGATARHVEIIKETLERRMEQRRRYSI